jgi:hypothetical protein
MLKTTNTNDVIVIDDFIPLSLQEHYKNVLLKENFPWYYMQDITTDKNLQLRPAVSHVLYDNGTKISPLEIDILAHLGAEKFGWAINSIVNGKTILQFPLNQDLIGTEKDNLHIDIDPFYPHLVVLYYVLDADGDTIITNVKTDGKTPSTIKFENQPILQKITPKQGRVVLFNGSHYHTAEQPKNGIRCVINLNIY